MPPTSSRPSQWAWAVSGPRPGSSFAAGEVRRVEAIANATPSFRTPRAARARRAEAGLGLVLGALLIGLAALIEVFDVGPVEGRTLLSLLAEGSVGTGVMFLVVQLATVVLLALAANTSYGGLPVLAARLAADGALPHVFGLRGDRQVYRASILVLSVLAGGLLVLSGGQVTVLVPLIAIGVFVGFALCQAGEVAPDHWWQRVLFNNRGSVVARYAGRHTRAVVCRFRFRLLPRTGPSEPGPPRRERGLVLPRSS